MTALFLKLVDIRFELVIGYILKTSGFINDVKMYYEKRNNSFIKTEN